MSKKNAGRLPIIPSERFSFGLKPLTPRKTRLNESYEVIGFDTETLPYNYHFLRPGDKRPDVKHKDLYSVQVSRKDGEAEFFHASGEDFEPGVMALYRLFSRKSLAFAHNLAFDLSVLLGPDYLEFCDGPKEVMRGDMLVKGNIIDGQMAFAKFRFYAMTEDGFKCVKLIRLIDTANFYGRRTLEDIAARELSGQPDLRKFPKPDYLGKRLPFKEELPYFIDYAVQDAKLAEALGRKEAEKQAGLSVRFSNTPASLSRAIFRTKYQKRPMVLLPLNELKFIWPTYHGGRFESYSRGHPEPGKKVQVLDYNSLYPTAATFPLPLELPHLDKYTLNEFEASRSMVGFCRARFRFPEGTMYPCLPVVTGKLFFPLRGLTWATSYELRLALELGAELTEFACLGFEPGADEIDNPIREFMLDTYREKEELDRRLNELKKEGKELPEDLKQRRQLVKSVLTNFYGKFAEQHEDKARPGTWNAGPMFNPPIASLITGKAREILARGLIKYESHYTDTDSMMTSRKLDKKDAGTGLGKLKVELAKADAWLVRPKLYYARDSEGHEKMARHSFRSGKIFRELIMSGDPGLKIAEYKHERMLKPREAAKRRLLPRAFITQPFKISLAADNKRLYDTELPTLGDLRETWTGSEAPIYAPL